MPGNQWVAGPTSMSKKQRRRCLIHSSQHLAITVVIKLIMMDILHTCNHLTWLFGSTSSVSALSSDLHSKERREERKTIAELEINSNRIED